MENILKPELEIDKKMKVVPYDCLIVDNMRIVIKTKVNEESDRKAVVIGINPSVACEGKSDTTLTKWSKPLFELAITFYHPSGSKVYIVLFSYVKNMSIIY